ncbi:hypothetical protein JCM3774_003918 [Rhodotorula dairenensis]
MEHASAASLVGTSTVAYGAASPTPSSLLRSDDGQLAIVTRVDIHLLTPALGYAGKQFVDASGGAVRLPSAGTKGGLEALGDKGEARQTDELPWLKTAVTLDKKASIRWADWVDEYDINMPGVVENHWRAAAWSPSGLSHLGGCMLGAITTNGEALLFGPVKSAATGEWTETADLTSGLVRELAPDQTSERVQTPRLRREMVAGLLRCQTTAIAWSGPVPGAANDLSLLALGHRSGEVSIWRLDEERKPECLARVAPADEVDIVHVLSWSEWTCVASSATAQLAIADGGGRVFALSVTQDAHGAGVEAGPAVSVSTADGRGATQLCWANKQGELSRRLAYSKLGTINLATLEPDSAEPKAWKLSSRGVEEVELELVGDDRWMGATSWALCSGLAYLPHQDSLLVSLSSSAFYHLQLSPHFGVSPSASSTPGGDGALSPASLTSAARDVFEEVLSRVAGTKKDRFETTAGGAGGRIGKKEGGKVVGMVMLNEGVRASTDSSGRGRIGDVAFIFETVRPDASIYRPYGQMKTYLAVADLTGTGLKESTALDECMQVLSRPINARTACPLGKLLLPLHAVRRFSASTSFVEGLLQYLPLPPAPGDTDAVLPSVEASMRDQLEARIWADDTLEQIREKETLARALLREDALVEELRHEVQLAHTNLIRLLAKETLGRLASVLSSLDLTAEAKTVYARLLLASASTLPTTADSPQGETLPPEALSRAFEQPDVMCPACRAPVPLANTRYACCESGHQWERCSVTLDLISVVQARTCTACERKALLKSSDKVLHELLRHATCCLFCGGRWMRIR